MKQLKLTIILTLILFGCTRTDTIKRHPYPQQNISRHILNFKVKGLHDSIVKIFDFENQLNDVYLRDLFYNYSTDDKKIKKNKYDIIFSIETIKNAVFSKEYYKNPNAKNDIYVHCFGTPWYSKLYYTDNKPLKYRTAFIIKLKKVDENKTQIEIIAENPTVINGISSYGSHGAIALNTKVEPSSIEEYTLLLFIANHLGESNLPKIRFPITE